jgi:TIR domain
MPFKHPCFISYVHGEHELVRGFLDQFNKTLKAYLEPYFDLKPFIDNERLVTGERFNKKLAEAICHSVCMIVVYVPKYENHPFCLREYTAMEILEEERLKLMGEQIAQGAGLIIPIILRGRKEDLPKKIRDHIHFCDFSKFGTASRDISKNKAYVDKIDEIAQYIYDLYIKFKDMETDFCINCHSFTLPGEQEVKPWREKPKALAAPFVLREEIQ